MMCMYSKHLAKIEKKILKGDVFFMERKIFFLMKKDFIEQRNKLQTKTSFLPNNRNKTGRAAIPIKRTKKKKKITS